MLTMKKETLKKRKKTLNKEGDTQIQQKSTQITRKETLKKLGRKQKNIVRNLSKNEEGNTEQRKETVK